MDIIANFLTANDGKLINDLAAKVGVNSDQVSLVVSNLVPELNNGIQKRVAGEEGGFMGLVEGIDMSLLAKLVGGADSFSDDENQSIGGKLLVNILGGESNRSAVIGGLVQQSGISQQSLESLLPMLTTSFMGYFASSSGGLGSLLGGAGGDSMLGSLSGMLDADGDGEVGDDLLNMAKKFF